MTARTQYGVCTTGKVRYRNRGAARSAIDTVHQRIATAIGRPEQRLHAYRCPRCHGWHLTKLAQSQEESS